MHSERCALASSYISATSRTRGASLRSSRRQQGGPPTRGRYRCTLLSVRRCPLLDRPQIYRDIDGTGSEGMPEQVRGSRPWSKCWRWDPSRCRPHGRSRTDRECLERERGGSGAVSDAFEEVDPEERKAVVRTFLRFRLPVPPNEGLKLVELRGVEPLTPRLPALCSPN